MSIEVLTGHIRACTACHLSSKAEQLKPLPGKGAGRKYLIVGVAPSYSRITLPAHSEVMPFGNPAFTSVWLGKVLEELNLTDYWLTNLIKCSLPKNRQPVEDDWKTCISHFFFQEFYLTVPEKIICLGNVPFQILDNYDLPVQKYKVFHHSYIARNPNLFEEWKSQWKLIIDE